MPGQLGARGRQRSWLTCARSLRIGRGSHGTTKESRSFQCLCRSRAPTCRTRTLGFKVTALRTSGRPQPSFALGSSEGTPETGQPWVRADSFGCLVNAGAERSCSNLCGNTADSADVRACSPVSKSLVTLRIRSMANCGEHAAEGWRSRGRRFKSCHPDGK